MSRFSEIEIIILIGLVTLVWWLATGFAPLLSVAVMSLGVGIILAFLSWQTRCEREAAERRERIDA